MENKLRLLIRDLISEVAENSSDIKTIVSKYIDGSKYDISKGLGNCAFFAKDFSDWWYGRNGYPKIQRNGNCEIVFMPQDESFANNPIQKGEIEDHIVAMVDNTIIDFVYTDGKGVSRHISRSPSNQLNPKIIKFSPSLFEENGLYGKYGYLDTESKSWANGNQISTSIPNFIGTYKFPPFKEIKDEDLKERMLSFPDKTMMPRHGLENLPYHAPVTTNKKSKIRKSRFK